MKYVVIFILACLVALPIVSWVLYGYDWGVLAWFGLIALLALIVIIVHKNQGKKLF